MLFFPLIASALLLVLANRIVRRSQHPGIMVGFTGLAWMIGPFFMPCALPTVAIQSLLVWIAAIVYRPQQEDARLRKAYPFESMEERIPEPRSDPERTALDAVNRGEDLVFAQVGDHLRMLGAIRSVKPCVECHGGGRGDLLGAFSYTFQTREHPGAGAPYAEGRSDSPNRPTPRKS